MKTLGVMMLCVCSWVGCGPRDRNQLQELLTEPTQDSITMLEAAGNEGVVILIGWLAYDCSYAVQEINKRDVVAVATVGMGPRSEVINGRVASKDVPARPVNLVVSHPWVVDWAKKQRPQK